MSAYQLVEQLKLQPSAQHFLTLPSVDDDPDYYDEVKTPISLADIHAKACRGGYPTAAAVREDFTLMLTNTRDLDGADSDSARVKESYTLETAFDEILGSLPQINGGVKEPVDDDDDDDDESRKRKAGDEAGEAKDQDAAPQTLKEGEGSADPDAPGSPDGPPGEEHKQIKKKAKRETEEEIRALHRTGGNATMLAERQDCTLYWLRKLMGYKDREYTELR